MDNIEYKYIKRKAAISFCISSLSACDQIVMICSGGPLYVLLCIHNSMRAKAKSIRVLFRIIHACLY